MAIMKARNKLGNNASRFAKRPREAAHPELEKVLLLWLMCARSSNLPVSGPILWEKANEVSLQNEDAETSLVNSALQAHNIAANFTDYTAADDDLCREDTPDDCVGGAASTVQQ
ncbi:hypothetical protein HPB49_017278 [Dermacentor silvarum]|uniref:Uncharacterized protein n=1 Tax=Dermacentor silvarum TaxID=543639 RepID=A0ACB8CYJ8_DERSI|nr:hypothetical protein HPB49_017278 [Dermacentor silvarum]